MARTSRARAGALPIEAVPWVRRMPRHARRTSGSVVGDSWPAWRWAWLIDVSRRDSSAVDRWVAMSDRYRISVAGSAGSALTPRSSHQVEKIRQSVAYARRVAGARLAAT
jgi:hypothetical protein